ncbi:MAG: VCBS repeat-containing protein [Pyrinomonadaceae bacterium]|nr:VCBS repeat-containing protein [Pyrinomonadaceae bacterium]MBP6214149.1 VCBS repeat-containing protein [Pyrinomonadaceae bacterium]
MHRSSHAFRWLPLFALVVISLFTIQAVDAQGVDLFAARSFGGNNAMFYATSAGDFDGDGKSDVVTASYDKLYVFFGNGSGKYESAPLTVYSYNSNTNVFPLAADFNSDGRSDLAFFRNDPQTSQMAIAVYFGNANRTFSAPVFSSPTPMPTDLKAVDMDQDGKLDLVGPAGNNLIVTYKGDLSGTFVVLAQANAGAAAVSVAPVDLDNDGLIDLAYGTSQELRAVRNLGGGSYGSPQTIGTITFGYSSVRAADLNNDGKPDLIASQATTTSPVASVWLGAGGFAFTQAPNITLNTSERAFLTAVADLDLDGKRDLVFSSVNRTLVHRGIGDGTFAAQAVYTDGGGGDAFVRDLNNDGFPDIVANQSIEFAVVGSGSFTVLINRGNGTFNSAPAFKFLSGTKDIEAAHLNADTLPDLVIVNRGSGGAAGPIYILVQGQAAGAIGGEPKFTPAEIIREEKDLVDPGVDGYAAATGDFTSDGRTDIIVVGHGALGAAENAMLLRNLGNNTFMTTLLQFGTGDIYDAIAADVSGDGKPDMITTGAGGVLVSLGVGNGTFLPPTAYLPGVASSRIVVTDLNNDTHRDLAILNYNAGTVSILLNNGSGSFTASPTVSPGSGLLDIACADMNRDDIKDIIAARGSGVTFLRGNGNGTFGSGQTSTITQVSALRVATGDWNQDGVPDVGVIAGSNTIVTLLNNGFGGLGQERMWTAGVDATTLTTVDFDSDQKTDIVAGFTTSTAGYVKLFFNQTAPSVLRMRAPFDFDGDGKTDLSVFRPGSSEWWISRSGGSGVFAAQFGSTGDRIAPADFTGDGKTDVALWRPSNGTWYVLRSEDLTYYAFPFGSNGDVPMPADFDADGKTDAAVFRPAGSTWYVQRSSDAQISITQFGTTGDRPVAADYDGDGRADIAIFRPAGAAGAEWWISRSTGGTYAATFGTSTDLTVPGDWTGDGKADIAFWRPSNGFWYVLRSEDSSFYAFPFGSNGDVPSPGDFDGDGKIDAAVFRQPGSQWFVSNSGGGTTITQFGTAGDTPLPSAFVR